MNKIPSGNKPSITLIKRQMKTAGSGAHLVFYQLQSDLIIFNYIIRDKQSQNYQAGQETSSILDGDDSATVLAAY